MVVYQLICQTLIPGQIFTHEMISNHVQAASGNFAYNRIKSHNGHLPLPHS